MRTQASQRQGRLAPRGQDEPGARRRFLDQGREDRDRVARAQDLDVVEDEDELAAAGDQRVRGSRHGVAQVLGVVIGVMQRDPCEGTVVVLGPLEQRGRLAIAGRRQQERERDVVDVHQPPDQTIACDEALHGTRRRGAARAAP